jgi:hypothetical protein
MARWNPAKHPRDKNGKFKGKGATPASAKSAAARVQRENDKRYGASTSKVTASVQSRGLFGRKKIVVVNVKSTSKAAQRAFIADQIRQQNKYR